MSIASVTSTTGVNGAATSSKVGQGLGGLGADDFVKLLTTQLQNQDPTDPVDNTQMLAQLAQFSSLSNLNDIKDSVSGNAEQAETLSTIATKLDTLNSTVAQLLAQQSSSTPTTA
ncbi:MAG: hypothetical protein B7Y31_00460 [Novosphingobium sp. 16-62-11]|nr:MAG: hypothetical protein B7Y74_01180 [Novosphingobium sp. 35-62-5]OYZ46745.1 MAG: hypothetical protein B7Y31_00460 [Novosphingobium sp. 16-62-11]OZA62551.1 MAG: hypothetical protein B7X78_06275 [Sphingomonadales bacterium 39-62-4]HQS96589.1 flagellar hook capping FlgD N-terminal domain-containing protein [Novosphingobium sp.]